MTNERDAALKLLKIARGQVDGIVKMIEDERYCIDIANQVLAAQSLLKKAELNILQGHLRHCVKEACEANNPEDKIAELNKLLEKILTR